MPIDERSERSSTQRGLNKVRGNSQMYSAPALAAAAILLGSHTKRPTTPGWSTLVALKQARFGQVQPHILHIRIRERACWQAGITIDSMLHAHRTTTTVQCALDFSIEQNRILFTGWFASNSPSCTVLYAETPQRVAVCSRTPLP